MRSARRTVSRFVPLLTAAVVPWFSSCSSRSTSNSPSACSTIPIDHYKELSILDEEVVTDTRAMNSDDGAWSFRHAVENMVPMGADPGAFVLNWFTEWATITSLNGYAIPDGPAAVAGQGTPSESLLAGMNSVVLCPWMVATASNGCSPCTPPGSSPGWSVSSCTANPPTLDLAKAPFRLLAVVNRMDLREQLGINPLGEGRLVYGLTQGPGDDPSSAGLPMTLIFEYKLPPTKSLTGWADAWHALGSFPTFNEDFNTALQAITDTFVLRNAMPDQPNGSALSQARTNESALFWVWQMRQFELGSNGQMQPAPLRNTPDPGSDGSGSSALVQYLQENSLAVQANQYLIPPDLLSGSADPVLYTWAVPNVDQGTEVAFANGTCNGCHSTGTNPPIDTFFHISPLSKYTGTERLSPFEVNVDLAARSLLLQDALCGQ